MVSSDLRELMAMCDRIGVMSAGRLVAVFERGEWSEQSLLAAAFSDATGRAGAPAGTATSVAPAAPGAIAAPDSTPVTADTP
jgi:ribose transport system ATP-binding protein